MKAMITGANGMLAQAFIKSFPKDWELLPVDIDVLDVTDELAVQDAVQLFKPELIVNCAAFAQVDLCEQEKERAFLVNGAGPGNIADAARQIGAFLVHFSTDYVFDGSSNTPYQEEDPIHPINVYGASKWEGECQIRTRLQDHLIIRTQWLYGSGGNHFVDTVLNLAKTNRVLKMVHDQVGSPTWTEDLSKATLELIKQKVTGTYHLTNSGCCSWYEFACKIVEEAGLRVELLPCSSAEFPRAASRPLYSALSVEKAKEKIKSSLPHWEIALKQFICSGSEP